MSKKQLYNDEFKFPFKTQNVFPPEKAMSNDPFDWYEIILNSYCSRIEKYSDLPDRLMDCRSSQEIYELQLKFFDKMSSDYREEAKLVSEKLFDLVRPLAEII